MREHTIREYTAHFGVRAVARAASWRMDEPRKWVVYGNRAAVTAQATAYLSDATLYILEIPTARGPDGAHIIREAARVLAVNTCIACVNVYDAELTGANAAVLFDAIMANRRSAVYSVHIQNRGTAPMRDAGMWTKLREMLGACRRISQLSIEVKTREDMQQQQQTVLEYLTVPNCALARLLVFVARDFAGEMAHLLLAALRLNTSLHEVALYSELCPIPGNALVQQEMRMHYRVPHVRCIARMRTLCQAGRARSSPESVRSVAEVWLCERAPLWAVTHVCALLRAR